MIKIEPLSFLFIAFLIVVLAGVTGCFNNANNPIDISVYKSFRDIPGVTAEEIESIETFQKQGVSFVYGVTPTTEAFLSSDGEIRGYASFLCEWLTELFGIPFVPENVTWTGLLDGLKNGDVDFTGDLSPTEERRKIYYMTNTTAHRWLCCFRIDGTEPLQEIAKTRPLRYVLIEQSTTAGDVFKYAGESFEPVYALEYEHAYELLKEGMADALVTENTAEAFYDNYDDIVMENFLPLLYSPVSLSTRNPALKPFISIVEKALENGASKYFGELYDRGYKEYKKHKLLMMLTEEEKEYINRNPVIYYAAEYDNYPSSFYNSRNNEWQGVVFDVLDEIQNLTGLKFKLANDENTIWNEMLEMLETGEVAFVAELIWTEDRQERFLWPDESIFTDRSVLISKTHQDNISMYKVPSIMVGLPKGTAHAEFFIKWFPNNGNIVIYDSQDAAYSALLNGEVEMIMSSYSNMLYMTNYLERVDVKPNIIFDNDYGSTFGFNKDEAVLCSIFSKAIDLVDIGIISDQWINRTYDYRVKVAEGRRPYLIGSAFMASVILALVIFIFYTNKLKIKHTMEERKLTKEFTKAEEHIKLMLNLSPLACLLWDDKLNFIDCNEPAVRIFRYVNKRELVERWFSECTPEFQPDGSSSKDMEYLHFKIAIEEGKCSFTWMYQAHDGSPLPMEIELIRTQNENGIILVQYMKDLREINKVTHELEKRDILLQAVNRTASVLLSAEGNEIFDDLISKGLKVIGNCVDADCVEIWKNEMTDNIPYAVIKHYWHNNLSAEAVSRITADFSYSRTPNWYQRLSAGEIIKGTADTLSKEDREYVSLYRVKSTLIIPINIRNQYWGMCCVDNFKRPHTYSNDEIDIIRSGILMVISALIRHDQAVEVREALNKANEASKAKTDFLAKMSHEIRTPMNAILGITEIQLRDEKIPAEIEEGLEKIYDSGTHLMNIINDILDLSKIEAGKLDIIPVKYDIASLVNDVVQINRFRYDAKPIEFILDVNEQTPLYMNGDELRIKQIMGNILSNAFKYTDKGRIEMKVWAEDSFDGQGNKVTLCFSICDTGQGMKPDEVAVLFDEYTRFNMDANRTTVGTGLGMNITKHLLNLMDGQISVNSEFGSGSVFTVRIPQEKENDLACGKEISEKLNNFHFHSDSVFKKTRAFYEQMPYGRVLVVDDIISNIYVTKGMLLPYGLKIDTALSGFEAIEKIKAGNVYDIIFMDHMMPKMDGIETAKKLREWEKDRRTLSPDGYSPLIIIALTANAIVGQSEMFLKNGFDGYISKPIDSRELNQILNEFIRSKKPSEPEKNGYSNAQEQEEINTEYGMEKYFVLDAMNAITSLESVNFREMTDKEMEDLDITVHGMKSALANIKENELSGAAYKLEKAIMEKDFIYIEKETPVFIHELKSLIKKFNVPEASNGKIETGSKNYEQI